jgi:signal transduction histidine kinase
MNPRSIEFRLIFLYCVLLIVLGAGVSFLTVNSFNLYTRETTRTQITARAGEVWDTIKGVTGSPEEIPGLIEQRFLPEALDRFIGVAIGGRTIYRSGAPVARSFDPRSVPLGTAPEGLSRFGNLSLYTRVFTAPDGKEVVIESGQTDVFAKGVEKSLIRSLIISLPFLLLFAALGGYVLIRRSLHPVELMIEAAESYTFNDPHNRLPRLGTGDRIEMLSLALNRMLDRLDGAYQHASRFSADAAHELRTPLAIIRGELELVAADPAGASIAALDNVTGEVERLSGIVDSLVTLSRMDSLSGKSTHSVLDLKALANETIDQIRLLADEKKIALTRVPGREVLVAGDRSRLKQVLVNLIDNAIKYTNPGGTVVVDVRASGDKAELAVSDSGIGIAPGDQGMIFDRFYRVSTDRGAAGAGLGLAIVKSICHAHGGTIEVSSKLGEGSTFCVKLPLARDNQGSADQARTA